MTIDFTPEGEETVIDAHKKVVERNVELIQRLASVGKGIELSVMTDIALDALVDLIMSEEQKEVFEFHRDMRINAVLEKAVEKVVSGLIVPGGAGA